jgi:hypothetical protein
MSLSSTTPGVTRGRGVLRRPAYPTAVVVLPQRVELANLAGDTLEEIIAAAERGIQRIRDTHHLAYSFLRHCGLSLW